MLDGNIYLPLPVHADNNQALKKNKKTHPNDILDTKYGKCLSDFFINVVVLCGDHLSQRHISGRIFMPNLRFWCGLLTCDEPFRL